MARRELRISSNLHEFYFSLLELEREEDEFFVLKEQKCLHGIRDRFNCVRIMRQVEFVLVESPQKWFRQRSSLIL